MCQELSPNHHIYVRNSRPRAPAYGSHLDRCRLTRIRPHRIPRHPRGECLVLENQYYHRYSGVYPLYSGGHPRPPVRVSRDRTRRGCEKNRNRHRDARKKAEKGKDRKRWRKKSPEIGRLLYLGNLITFCSIVVWLKYNRSLKSSFFCLRHKVIRMISSCKYWYYTFCVLSFDISILLENLWYIFKP